MTGRRPREAQRPESPSNPGGFISAAGPGIGQERQSVLRERRTTHPRGRRHRGPTSRALRGGGYEHGGGDYPRRGRERRGGPGPGPRRRGGPPPRNGDRGPELGGLAGARHRGREAGAGCASGVPERLVASERLVAAAGLDPDSDEGWIKEGAFARALSLWEDLGVLNGGRLTRVGRWVLPRSPGPGMGGGLRPGRVTSVHSLRNQSGQAPERQMIPRRAGGGAEEKLRR